MFKKIISSILLMAGVSAFAAGTLPINSTYSGVFSITNAAVGVNQTNVYTFPSPYSVPPVVFAFASVTNFLPLTNIVTTSNLTTIVATPTNGQVAFTLSEPVARVAYGNVFTTANTPTNVSFGFTFASLPTVVAGPTFTNFPAAITAVTLTNFTLSTQGSQTNNWIAVGPVYYQNSGPTGPVSY